MNPQQKWVELLASVIPPEDVRTDQESLENYGRDWTRQHNPSPAAIVFPRSTTQVREVTLLANQHNLALVPSGGRTGLSGGALAAKSELVVSFDRMNKVLGFDPVDRQVICQAGVVTQQLQQFACDKNLFYPVDFASSGSSQVGGNIATNAGGIKVIGYGLTRNWVAGLTVVTGKGEILTLNNGLTKNATGYDLRQVFIGSEGTLGFITEAIFNLMRPPKNLTVLVLGVPEFTALMQVLETFRKDIELTAFEFFSATALNLVTQKTGLQKPFAENAPYYALLEYDAYVDEISGVAMRLFEDSVAQGWVLDGVMSQNETQAKNLWRLREDISESIAEFMPYKNDLSVKVSCVPEFLNAVDQVVETEYPEFEVVWYGHIGDGNLHLNILKPDGMELPQFVEKCAAVNHSVFEIVSSLGGSISAEHGVGVLKREYLNYSRSSEEITYMQGLKQVFDPNGIMNPGKIFE